jgi:protein tyrosine phosphatase
VIADLDVEGYRALDLNSTEPRLLPTVVVETRKLNRYLDILPNPTTRVKLLPTKLSSCPVSGRPLPRRGTQEWTDHVRFHRLEDGTTLEDFFIKDEYYNANNVRGYSFGGPSVAKRAEYIAAEGPTEVSSVCIRCSLRALYVC